MLNLLGLKDLDALSPRIEKDFSFKDLGEVYPAEGERRGRVALLIGCIASVAFAELNRATIRVLTKNGVEVHIPPNQGCCGALHLHGGMLDGARALARHNIDAMLSPQFDAIITNAAGCGSSMKEYAALLQEDATYVSRAAEFSAKTKDINEYLADLGLREPKRKLEARITYQDPCHLAHARECGPPPATAEAYRSQPRRIAASGELLRQRRNLQRGAK